MVSDKQVYEFINSQECYDFYALRDFLIENNTPLHERYSYYFLGKQNFFNEDYLDAFIDDKHDIGHGCVFPFFEMFHWHIWLYREDSCKQGLKEALIEFNEVIPADFDAFYVKEAWSNVLEETELSHKILGPGSQIEDDYTEYKEPLDNEDLFCESCQSSPCMCSDADQSSYVSY